MLCYQFRSSSSLSLLPVLPLQPFSSTIYTYFGVALALGKANCAHVQYHHYCTGFGHGIEDPLGEYITIVIGTT
jgi:hypothetical protein